MTHLLSRLEAWLRTQRPEYWASLRAGTSDAALEAFERRFAVQLPESFKALYRWRDGQALTVSAGLYGNRMFSSLEDISDTKAMLDQMIGTEFDDPAWWRTGWVPFLANGAGDHLCLDTRAEQGGNPGQLIAFWHDWNNRSTEAVSLELWLEELLRKAERGQLKLR